MVTGRRRGGEGRRNRQMQLNTALSLQYKKARLLTLLVSIQPPSLKLYT